MLLLLDRDGKKHTLEGSVETKGMLVRGSRQAPINITTYHFINEAVSNLPQRLRDRIEQDISL